MNTQAVCYWCLTTVKLVTY